MDAEKGKVMYSTKEVDAIKEQNRALKIELYSSKKEVCILKEGFEQLNYRSSKTISDVNGIENTT